MSDASPTADRSSDPIVRVLGLTRRYQENDSVHSVFEGLDLEVDADTFTVVMGRSGAGKTTLLNLISGIDRPDAGTVWIAGTPVTELSDRDRTLFRRRRMGFVFQAFNLISTLTVGENVRLPLELAGLDEVDSDERARDLLDRVGLAGRSKRFPDQLSGGERQRVAVVRALAHDPAIVLVDEPTGNLDYETGRRVVDLMAGLTRERGTTLLAASHDPVLIRSADRVLEMVRGGLRERSEKELAARFREEDARTA